MTEWFPTTWRSEDERTTVLAAAMGSIAILLTVPVQFTTMALFDELRLDAVVKPVLAFVVLPAVVVSLFAYVLGRHVGGPRWARLSALVVLIVAVSQSWYVFSTLSFCGAC